MENSDNKLFFEKVDHFPKINDDGLIETQTFLQAAKYIVEFVNLFGTTFKPVKNDIEGNINKLTNLFQTDIDKFKYLNSIVKIEKETLDDSEFHIGTDALMWLNRALVYNQLFISFFLKEYQNVKCEEDLQKLSEDISNHFGLAYDLSLKKHHGWFVQKIFSVCMMAAPSRTTLLTYLGYSKYDLSSMDLRNILLETIEIYLNSLKQNTEAVGILLLSNGFQP